MKLGPALLVAMAISLAGCAQRPAPAVEVAEVAAPRPVYVIRHLQKAAGDDPPLSAEGAANAQKLARLLQDKGIAAIFATRTRRAMETAGPLARRLGLTIIPYEPRGFAALADAIAKAPRPALVVGHSNTVPDIVAYFGAPRPMALGEGDYGTLFILGGDGTVATVELR